MNTARIRLPAHKPLKILPWYVNCTLDPKEATKVAAHVSGCPVCQREVDDLAKLFATRARLEPKRPVDEGRLDDLFARIDRYEAERRHTPRVERVSLRERLFGMMDWLVARPALAGACAALLLAVIAVPMLTSRTAQEGAYRVLEDPDAVTEPLRVRLHFQAPPAQVDVDRAVKASLAQQKLATPYRIERQPNGEYVVTFAKKPDVAAMSLLLEELRRTSNADVSIDGG